MVFLLSFNHFNKIKNLKLIVLLLYFISRDLWFDINKKMIKNNRSKTKLYEKACDNPDVNGIK